MREGGACGFRYRKLTNGQFNVPGQASAPCKPCVPFAQLYRVLLIKNLKSNKKKQVNSLRLTEFELNYLLLD